MPPDPLSQDESERLRASHSGHKNSFLGSFKHNKSLDESRSNKADKTSSANNTVGDLRHASGASQRMLSKHDFSQRLSSLAIDNNNQSMCEEIAPSELDSSMPPRQERPDTQDYSRKFKDDNLPNSKRASTRQSTAERRKVKRETLASYLKTSDRPVQSRAKQHSSQVSTTGRSSGTLTRKTDDGMQRHSSKTSMQSQ